MAKADVITLAQVIAGGVADEVTLGDFYDEAQLALADTEITVETHIIAVTAGEPSYPYPTNAMRVLTAFFGARELLQSKLNALEVASRTWSGATGTPVTWIETHEPERTVHLYPAPDTTSAGWFPAVGEPFGLDYPSDRLILLTAEEEVAPPWLDLPLALASLVDEFRRESDHRDPMVSAAAVRLAKLIRNMGGAP